MRLHEGKRPLVPECESLFAAFGSVAEKTVRLAGCQVLVVRAGKDED